MNEPIADTPLAGPPALFARGAYISGLDGLRAVAVLLVLVGHFGLENVVPGGLGVTVFFFISGFLITTLLTREAHAHGAPARVAVQHGLRAGRSVVTAAAIIMISVFAGFIFSHDATIKPIGFGLAFGVLLDAFVVRKAAKAHGMQRQIEGPDISGRRVVVVEDTTTTGGSPIAAIEALGVPYHSLFGLPDLGLA